jgi:hypothetical protein
MTVRAARGSERILPDAALAALLLAGCVIEIPAGLWRTDAAWDARTPDNARTSDIADRGAADQRPVEQHPVDQHPVDGPTIVQLATFSKQVSAQANIYGAGHPTPPAPGGGGAGQLPVLVSLPAGVDREVQFTSVTGSITCYSGHAPMPADGEAAAGYLPWPSWDGLAGAISQDLRPGLVAVFLDGTEPTDPPPAQLNVGDGKFTELGPALRQVFWVGDGLSGTGSGTLQRFHVPASATRLFLGIVDRLYNTGTQPGYYQDNSGTYQVAGVVLGR